VSFLQYWQLRQRGVSEAMMRGGLPRPRPNDEPWLLPHAVRLRLRPLLQDLGFDLGREVWVREVPQQRVFRLTQRAVERPTPPEKRERRWIERLE
jgi:hypothetical protein